MMVHPQSLPALPPLLFGRRLPIACHNVGSEPLAKYSGLLYVCSATRRVNRPLTSLKGSRSSLTGELCSSVMIREFDPFFPALNDMLIAFVVISGIGGGVVSQPYFQDHFGFATNKKKSDDISSNVVSVLQAGAFFGALGSAPVSAWIGRRYTLLIFTLIFSVGAVSFLFWYCFVDAS